MNEINLVELKKLELVYRRCLKFLAKHKKKKGLAKERDLILGTKGLL